MYIKNSKAIILAISINLLFLGHGFMQVNSINTKSTTLPDEQVEGSGGSGFTDTDGHIYEESITYLQGLGVVKGYPDGSFGPDRSITRGEMMKIVLLSSLGEAITPLNNCFPDVTTQRYAPYICYAKKQAIIGGYPDGSFGPENNVTNAEGLKIILESFNAPVEESTGRFWYQPYLDFAHTNNMLSKYALYPDTPMTRGMMAHLAHQLHKEKQGKITFSNTRQNRSKGCGKTPPKQVPTTLLVNGIQRSMITYVGKNYDQHTPIKLIVAFHGRTNSNKQVQGYYKIQEASQGNAIIVYPLGLPESGPSRTWNTDFAIFDGLVEKVSDEYCINMDEIYVMGHSLGAWYTNSLACGRGDVIRAIGSVGGGTTKNTCTGPVASIIMHNPEDRLASFASGIQARDQLLKQNQCGPETTPLGPNWGNCVAYTNCLNNAPVTRCPHSDSTAYDGRYYPHTRPDAAGQEIWDFFTTHSG